MVLILYSSSENVAQCEGTSGLIFIFNFKCNTAFDIKKIKLPFHSALYASNSEQPSYISTMGSSLPPTYHNGAAYITWPTRTSFTGDKYKKRGWG